MSLFVPDGFLYDSIEELRANHPSVEAIEVIPRDAPTRSRWPSRDRKMVERIIEQINLLGGKNHRFKIENEGCRLIRAAANDIRPEFDNEEEVFDALMMVVDWGAMHWLQSLKMRKYFTPSSLFRKGKWRERMEQIDRQVVISGDDW